MRFRHLKTSSNTTLLPLMFNGKHLKIEKLTKRNIGKKYDRIVLRLNEKKKNNLKAKSSQQQIIINISSTKYFDNIFYFVI